MGRRAFITGLICAAPLAAAAATLPIEGTYGTELGCRVAKTGEYIESPDTYTLTSEGVGNAVTYCMFSSVKAGKDGRHSAELACSQEGSGEEGDFRAKADIEGTTEAGYTVRFADGTTWGPLAKCR